MWPVIAITIAILTFAVAMLLVQQVRRRPLALAAQLALAVVVCFEAILLQILSLWEGVTRSGVLIGHVALLAAIVAWRFARGSVALDVAGVGRRVKWSLVALGKPALLTLPLALAAAASARFAPNTWDSMVYHLARVAHWIQNGSVALYPTHVDRQNVLQPAAEYLLVAVQVVAGTDRLANGLQLTAWALLVVAAPSLARLAGASKRIALWCGPLVASLPMGVLQASSTQNDLVAGVLALALVAAAVPFLHRAHGPTCRDIALLGVAIAAATVVKVTALVAAAPLLALATGSTVLQLARGKRFPASNWRGLLAAVAVVAAVVGPEWPRFVMAASSHNVSHFMNLAPGGMDRLFALGAAIARHVPAPRYAVEGLHMVAADWCVPGERFCTRLLLPHEEVAGNPLHVLLAITLVSVAMARWRRMPPRAHMFLLAPMTAWFAFHLLFRDNPWISRLETPTFALIPLLLAATVGLNGFGARRARAALFVASLLAVAYGTAVAYRNVLRPPFGDAADEVTTYYARNPRLRRPHDITLEVAAKFGCRRLGLAIGPDSYDYPLTWRAMRSEIAVRHVFGRDPWPCLIFAEGVRDARPEVFGWRRTPLPFLYMNSDAAP